MAAISNRQKLPLYLDRTGASLVEFAIVFPLMMFILLSAIDLCRYMILQSLLNKAAHDGVMVAVKTPNLDIDLHGLSTTSKRYQAFAKARERVINAALHIPLSTMFEDESTDGSNQLISFTMIDSEAQPDPDSGQAPAIRRSAALIRPGDRVILHTSEGDRPVYNILVPNKNDMPPRVIMSYFPVIVQLNARMTTITPFLPNLMVVGRANAVRQPIPEAVGEWDGEFVGEEGEEEGENTTTTTTTSTTTSTLEEVWTCVPDWEKCVRETKRQEVNSQSLCPKNYTDDGSGRCCCQADACARPDGF